MVDREIGGIFLKQIGKGAFAKVELYRIENGFTVLKRFNATISRNTNSEIERKFILNESRIHANLDHQNVVRCIRILTVNDEICLQLEYCPDGTLADVIDRQRNMGATKQVMFSVDQIREWTLHISFGLSYLHSQEIIHRDLKPQNIFVTGDILKIGDFGLAVNCSTENDDDHPELVTVGTMTHMAPEFFQKDNNFKSSPKIDIWSLGVIVYELATLKLPFQVEPRNVMPNFDFETLNGNIHRLINHNVLRSLLTDHLLVFHPTKRSSIDVILEHRFLNAQENKCQMKDSDQHVLRECCENMKPLEKNCNKKRQATQGKINEYFDAVKQGNAGAVKGILRKHLVNVDVKDEQGFTALMVASSLGDARLVRMLAQVFKANVDVQTTINNGQMVNAVVLASQNSHLDVVNLLIQEFGAKI